MVTSDHNVTAEILENLCKYAATAHDYKTCLTYARKLLKLPLGRDSIWLLNGYLRLVRALAFLGRTAEAFDALKVATKHCDYTRLGALSSYLEVRALAEQHASMKAACLRDFQLAADLLQAVYDPWTHVMALNNFACAAARFGEVALANEMHLQAMRLAQKERLDSLLVYTKLSRIESILLLGKIEEADSIAREMSLLSGPAGSRTEESAIKACCLSALTGETFHDPPSAQRVLAVCIRSGVSARISANAAAFHMLFTRNGMTSEARTVLSTALPYLDATLFGWSQGLWLGVEVARYGQMTDCTTVLGVARPVDDITVEGILHLIRARIAQLQSDEDALVLNAGLAEAVFRRIGFAYFEAVAMELGGRLRAAYAAYDSMGATADVKRLHALQRDRGKGMHLTPRQEQVVSLIMQGLALDQVAVKLQISIKTTEHHLEAAMQSLGVTKREQLKCSPYTAHLQTID